MSGFSRGQVLRVKHSVTVAGVKLATGTRVRVNSQDEDTGRWKVRVEDSAQPSLTGTVVSLSPGNFRETHRGRPVGSKNRKPTAVASTDPVTA